MTIDTVVFDLGNVLIAWDPTRLYRHLIPDADERQRFLSEVCSAAWHDRQDRGASCVDSTIGLATQHPHQRELIEAYYGRWWEMLAPMPASVDVVRELHKAGTRLLALTNWPSEMFVEARARYPFLELFEGIVVSGDEGVAKPDEAIFRLLLDRYDVDPSTAAYIDDKPEHVASAAGLGLSAYPFVDVSRLRRDLAAAGLPVDAAVGVRPGDGDDVSAITDIYNHYVTTTAATFDTDVKRVEQRRGWFQHYGSSGRHRLLVATVDGEVKGYATSSAFRGRRAYEPTVEVTVYLAPDAGGRGLGTMLYQQLLTDLAGEDVHSAMAAIALPNDASIALHRRFGFVDAGLLREVGRKFDRWWDVLYLQRRMP